MASITSSNTNGASASYSYDDLNRLSTVVDNRLGSTTSYSYDPASNLATATYPNGLKSSFTYDPLNRLTALNAGTASYSYQLGPTGNRTQATEGNGRTLQWSYDGIYRLTNEQIASDPNNVNGSVAYGLDPVGNRLTETSSLNGVNSGSFGYNAGCPILPQPHRGRVGGHKSNHAAAPLPKISLRRRTMVYGDRTRKPSRAADWRPGKAPPALLLNGPPPPPPAFQPVSQSNFLVRCR